MKSTMRARVHDFARKNNYRITVWQVPDKDSGRWHIKLESSKINKPSLDFIANVKRSPNNLLTIDLIHMPAFISTSSAVWEKIFMTIFPEQPAFSRSLMSGPDMS